jgi:hypothetical protein
MVNALRPQDRCSSSRSYRIGTTTIVEDNIFWHTGCMPADPFTLRQADQARTDFAIIEDELKGDP